MINKIAKIMEKNKITKFLWELFTEIKKDAIVPAANDLTYRIFFSAFPFAIFLISVAGFMRLDENLLVERILYVLPDVINNHAETFINEIINRRNANILSFSLIISVYSAAGGFRTATRSINRAYNLRDTRKFHTKILISIALVVIFSAIIILCLALLVFGDIILRQIFYFIPNSKYMILFNILRYIVSIVILFFSIILINKIALFGNKKTTLKSLSVGTLFTSVAWIAASAGFNVYMNNFPNFSTIYGGIGAVMILLLWINILCISLLIGSEINAVISLNRHRLSDI